MIKPELLKILCCSVCKSDLKYDKKKNILKCSKCKKEYPVKNDVPIMTS